MRKIIDIQNGQLTDGRYQMAQPVNFSLCEGEQIAIYGPNGAGKTRFVEIITGRHRLKPGGSITYDFSGSAHKYVSDNIKYITFRDSYGIADAGYYYQQRWNQAEIDPEFTPTAGKVLDEYRTAGADVDSLVDAFGLRDSLDKYVISLSSGELRKMQLIKLLITAPSLLIIDNPFLGLDVDTRSQLSELLAGLTGKGLSVILVVSRRDEIPSFITHVVEVDGLTVGPKLPFVPSEKASDERQIVEAPVDESRANVVKFNNISIRYDSRTILKDLNLTVRQGEHWILSGQNGCGKSTLLSLVCADNPQAYACDIELFGRKRGTGESIWDIKMHIGYVSPEMHRAYSKDMPTELIVASGLYDRAGLYFPPSEADMEIARRWMERFGIAELEGRSFMQISSGEQRLCLLARAFVKEPPLLILDEPMHGLDDNRKAFVRSFLDSYFTENPDKTLIMVTHYLDEMPDCIDHHLILQKNIL